MSVLYPGAFQIEAMKYAKQPSEKQIEEAMSSGLWCAQPKVDGAHYILEKIDAHNIYLFARTKSKTTGELVEKGENVPHIISWARNNLPDKTVLCGEIYVPKGKSNDVTKIMGCKPEKAHTRQFKSDEYGGPIHYYVFDILYYKGQNLMELPFEQRYDRFLKYELGNKFWEKVELAPTYYNNFELHLSQIFVNGGEGMVFKRKDSTYQPGKRPTSQYCFKIKEHMDSIDLVCMELLDPVMEYTGKEIDTWPYWYDRKKDKTYHWEFDPNNPMTAPSSFYDIPGIEPVTKHWYYGWKNAMRLGAYDQNGQLQEVCRVASGLDDAMRQDMAENPNNFLGKVIQISCMSLNKVDHTVRHPVFEKIRLDKPATDCLLSEIF